MVGDKTITVPGAEGYDSKVSYWSVGAIRGLLQKIDKNYAECKRKDGEEAKKGAEIAECPDRGKFEEQVNALVQETDQLLTDIWTTFTSDFEPKSSLVDDLVTQGSSWSKLGVKLDGHQRTIEKHLKADDWTSKGANVFKAALPTQQKAMNELEELCYRADQVLASSAAVNAGIFTATYLSLTDINSKVEGASLKPIANLEYWSDSGSSDDSSGCVSFNYYQRTTTAKANFQAMKTWLQNFVTTRGDWSGSAQMVATDIPTVQGSVVNLKTGGVWPDPKAQVTDDANVDDQTSTSGNSGSRTDTSGGGGGIDMNNKGGIFG